MPSFATTLPAPPPVAECPCGRCFDALEWAALPFVGVQECDGVVALELRNCPCESTRAVEVPAAPRSVAA
jgi:hypothetical protein